jgi:transposase
LKINFFAIAMTTYSHDLRERVIRAYEQTGHKSKVCQTFSIARSTLDKWLALRVETGGLAPRPHRIRGHSHKVSDLDAFREWVKSETPVERLEELIPRFEAHYGTPISYSNLHKWLQRIGWSHKKKPSATNKPSH